MARILITSGPTRQYLDPIRYLTNASSGQMGSCLAAAAIELDHDVSIVSGPASVNYPEKAKVIQVVSTQDMLNAAMECFPRCDGVIGAAAPCDFQPAHIADQKIKKSGRKITLELEETPDIMATLGQVKNPNQWSVAFALETENGRENALAKLARKNCDLIVLNDPTAIDSDNTRIKIFASNGSIVNKQSGSKQVAASAILDAIQSRLL